ncbi:MAG: hypothetical protein QOF60_1978 [Actinomycetota bacterium]|jgi:hypothetical protein|nr:hypothetical protein [Actinomycetota bacterium]
MDNELQQLVEQWGHEFAIQAELESDTTATWVDLAEAERQAGVSRSTLRAWYRGGQVASRLMPGPHGLQRLVPLEAVLARAERSPRTGPRPAPPTTTTPEEDAMPPHAIVRLAELATATATERAERAEARAEAAEDALHRALERAAAAEALLRAASVNAQPDMPA